MFRRKPKAPEHDHDWSAWKDFTVMNKYGKDTGIVGKQQRQCSDPFCSKIETRYPE